MTQTNDKNYLSVCFTVCVLCTDGGRAVLVTQTNDKNYLSVCFTVYAVYRWGRALLVTQTSDKNCMSVCFTVCVLSTDGAVSLTPTMTRTAYLCALHCVC